MTLNDLPQVATAIGGLGTAAFGFVDATKALWGGVNHIGFGGIKKAVSPLTGGAGLSQQKILATLKANWMNGTDLDSQKAIAKSLIKLNLSAANVGTLAAQTGLDQIILGQIASAISAGTPLTPAQSDVFARLDLTVTALLDEAYQHADQVYRNITRALAAIVAIVLAVVGGRTVGVSDSISVLAGLLATPLAPVAKDASTALATAVNTMQLIRK
jgi:hypothetical protein